MPHYDAVLTASLAVAVAASLVAASSDPAPPGFAGVKSAAASVAHAADVADTGDVPLGASLGVASPEAAKLKCPPDEPVLFPDAPEVVYVLDTEAVDEDVIADMDGSTIASLEIVCATDLHEAFGIEARRSGVVVFTAPSPHSELRASLDSISELQEAYLDEHGVYARDLSDLGWDAPSDLLTVELEVSDDGLRWSATGDHPWRFAETGLTVSGEASPR